MRLHQLRRFASLSKTAKVVSDGKTYELANVSESEPLNNASLEAAVSEIRGAARSIAAGQAKVVRAVEENTEALYQPVVPSYEKGKLTGAHRARK